MRVLLLAACAVASVARTEAVLDQDAPPCEGVMCQFLEAFREDLGKISTSLEQQVTLLQESSHSLLRKKDPKKDPMLTGMVSMMKDMYGKMKERIVKANEAEKQGKVDFEKRIADLEAKKKGMLSQGMKIDNTYDRIEDYWKKQRANSHRQYHNLLKLTHAGMSKFDKLMNLGKDAEAGKPLDTKALGEVRVGVPNVVLVELRSITSWAQSARSELAHVMRGK